MHSLRQDVCYGLRVLGKNPGFTALAVLTLALGVGANTAIFSILDPLLLRNLPIPNPDELVWVNSSGSIGPAEISEVETYNAYRDEASVFSSVFAFSQLAPYRIAYDGRTIAASGELVSANYFSALGVRPFAGRLLADSDRHGPPVLVVSFDFWERKLNSSPDAVGKILSFGDQSDATPTGSIPEHSFTMIGIAPPAFFGTKLGESPDFYVSLGATELPTQDYWQTHGVTILGRLKPGVSIAQTQSGLDPLFQQVEKNSTLPQVERDEHFAHVLLTAAARGVSEARIKFSLPAKINRDLHLSAPSSRKPSRIYATGSKSIP
jgi:hypothetical protein